MEHMPGNYRIVCAGCAATDRVPANKPAGARKCGKCGNGLFSGRPLDVNAGILEPGIRLIKLNSEAEPTSAGLLGIRSIPTLLLYASGHEIARISGAMNTQQIVKATARWGLHPLENILAGGRRENGKKPKLSDRQQKELRRMHDTGDYSVSDLVEVFSISRPTVYRTLGRQIPEASAA